MCVVFDYRKGLNKHMKKSQKKLSRFLVALLALLLVSGSVFAATVTPAKQLEKAKQLYAERKEDEAMDLFVDVLVNGSRAEVEEANKYINLIHNHMGGIQDPLEVSENFVEGETIRYELEAAPEGFEQQQVTPESSYSEQAVAEEEWYAPVNEEGVVEQNPEYSLTSGAESLYIQQQAQAPEVVTYYTPDQTEVDVTAQAAAIAAAEQQAVNATYTDLTSPAALQVRQLYTEQKLDSMQQAAIAKLERTPGVRVYFRNNVLDAIDIDSEVLFNGYKFRPDAYETLNEVYTLLALTQGAGYIILPPGSYTDNITLPGIRQAMALNSYLVHKGLSSGKITYNMGLFDEEPPAKFANLEGLSIVVDFDAELPAALPEAAAVSELPMLSMAVVPVSNKIDPSAGEAFAIDFSVIETAQPIDSWVLQIVQHAADGEYYIVRQLDGFSPVYHQVLWNARKGVIGPLLACGKYTLVLTATDLAGKKNTLRRQVEVECVSAPETKTEVASKKLNYKSARLWTKPGRIMRMASTQVVSTTVAEPEVVDPFASSNTNTHTETYHSSDYRELPDGSTVETTTTTTTTSSAASAAQGVTYGGASTASDAKVTNPYDMPYDEY